MTALPVPALSVALLACVAAPAWADHMTQPVQQMVASFEPDCQAGDAGACGAIQYVEGLESQMEQAYGDCDAGDRYACLIFQDAQDALVLNFGLWNLALLGGSTATVPQKLDDGMGDMYLQQGQFLDYLYR